MLILALDLLDKRRALEIAEITSEYIDMIKVNYPLVLSAGIEIISELSEIKPVIADFKIADIPYISSLIADIAFKKGAKAVIVHGFVGENTVKSVLDVAKKYGREVYLVIELTSESLILEMQSDEIIRIALKLGCHGIIAPATKPERIKRAREIARNIKIFSPGVGIQGGEVESVLNAGADGIIVGRSIYNSKDPARIAREFRDRIRGIRLGY